MHEGSNGNGFAAAQRNPGGLDVGIGRLDKNLSAEASVFIDEQRGQQFGGAGWRQWFVWVAAEKNFAIGGIDEQDASRFDNFIERRRESFGRSRQDRGLLETTA